MASVFLGTCEYLVKSMFKNITAAPNSNSFSVYIFIVNLCQLSIIVNLPYPSLFYFLISMEKAGGNYSFFKFLISFSAWDFFPLACIFLLSCFFLVFFICFLTVRQALSFLFFNFVCWYRWLPINFLHILACIFLFCIFHLVDFFHYNFFFPSLIYKLVISIYYEPSVQGIIRIESNCNILFIGDW